MLNIYFIFRCGVRWKLSTSERIYRNKLTAQTWCFQGDQRSVKFLSKRLVRDGIDSLLHLNIKWALNGKKEIRLHVNRWKRIRRANKFCFQLFAYTLLRFLKMLRTFLRFFPPDDSVHISSSVSGNMLTVKNVRFSFVEIQIVVSSS